VLRNGRNKRPRIPVSTQLKLWVTAGGRCEFGGCNEYLLRDNLTLSEANYSDIAHIIAASPRGPRGRDALPREKRSQIENLMLVCKKHHKLIDDKQHEQDYPKEKLLRFKEEHERRIHRLTSIQPDNKTTIVRFTSKIAHDLVAIPRGQIYEAIYPRYPVDDKGIEIDLTNLPGIDNPSYWKSGAQCIQERVTQCLSPGIQTPAVEHMSIFALGPIPFLIYLGSCLGNKIPSDVYQRHRDTEDWAWKKSGKVTGYRIINPNTIVSHNKVALILSLSGVVADEDLPKAILERCTVYRMTVDGKMPSPMYLRRRQELIAFKEHYQVLLRLIRATHPGLRQILLFPAVPAPVAVICGASRLPKVDPALVVYDYNQSKGTFYKTLTVR